MIITPLIKFLFFWSFFLFLCIFFVNWQANLEEPCSARMALLLRYIISGYVTSHVQ